MDYRLWTPNNASDSQSVVYIRAKGYSPDVQMDVSNPSSPQYTCLLKDHLGSPVRTVDNDGIAQDSARYDPWGLQVAASGVAADISNAPAAENTRGYTGHVLIASANTGQWNGRLFDYEMGAFPGPDKFIQGRSIAALNRFALGQHKNPNVVDPSGWANFRFRGTASSAAFREIASTMNYDRKGLKSFISENINPNATINFVQRKFRSGFFKTQKDYYTFRDNGAMPTDYLTRIRADKISDSEYFTRKINQLKAKLTEICADVVFQVN